MKNYILKELDKSKVYDLRDLNEEQLEMIYKHLQKVHENWKKFCFNEFKDIFKHHTNKLIFHYYTWFSTNSLVGNIVSAVELFEEIPPITEVQVDCSNLSKEHIDKLVEIVKKNGYYIWEKEPNMYGEVKYFLKERYSNDWLISKYCDYKTTITYDQFLTYYEEEKDINEIEVVCDVVEGAKAEQVYFDEAQEIKKLNNEFVRIENNTSQPFKIEIQPEQTVEIRYIKNEL